MLVFLPYIQPPLKRDRDCQNFSRRILFLDTRIFFCIFQSEATDNGIPVILNLCNVEYIELQSNINRVDIVSRATSVYYFHPSPPFQCCLSPMCPCHLAHQHWEGEEGGAVSCVPINVSVWGRSSDLVIMFSSWTRHSAMTVTLFYGLFYDSFISPVFFLYIVQITKHRDSN